VLRPALIPNENLGATKYFSQLVTQLCRMYADLDQLSDQVIDPYEKLTMLQEVIFTEWMGIDSGKTDSALLSYKKFLQPNIDRRLMGIELYQKHSIIKDVANVMEHEYIRAFIQKYFLQWDTSDLVVVLIKLYRCFDRFPDWTTEQKWDFCIV
jgi:transcription termination factor NusB